MLTQTTRSFPYLGDGVTTVFQFPAYFLDQTHLVLSLLTVSTGVVQLLSLGSDYTVSGVGVPAGGSCTLTVAPAVGQTLTIARSVPLTQLVDYVPNDPFPANTTETALDLITMALQQLRDADTGGGSGTGVTVASIGTGHAVYAQTIANVAQIRSIAQGTNCTISDDGSTITINGPSLATFLTQANNLSDVAARQTALNTLSAVGAATNEFVLTKDTATGNAIWKVVPTGGGGEANTSSNSGVTTFGLAQAKVGVNLPFKSLTAGANITLTSNTNDVNIAATGEANSAVNIGVTGTGVFTTKSGLNIQLKGFAAGLGITVSNNSTDITHAVNQAAALSWTALEKFLGSTAEFIPADETAPQAIKASRTAPTGGGSTVNNVVLIEEQTNAGTTSLEWPLLVRLVHNSNQTASDGVAGTFQSYKQGTAPVWAAVLESHNKSGSSANPHYGMEIDWCDDTTSPHINDSGLTIFFGAQTNTFSAGAATVGNNAIYIGPFVNARNSMLKGIHLAGTITEGIKFECNGTSAATFYGSYSGPALDLSLAASAPTAIKLGTGQAIVLGANGQLQFKSGSTWFSGAFAPSFNGALAFKVDAATVYVPTCSNHP